MVTGTTVMPADTGVTPSVAVMVTGVEVDTEVVVTVKFT
jgi:hypothetical protein